MILIGEVQYALEKQDPVKPIHVDHDIDVCRMCRSTLRYLDNYCSECGKKQYWGNL